MILYMLQKSWLSIKSAVLIGTIAHIDGRGPFGLLDCKDSSFFLYSI